MCSYSDERVVPGPRELFVLKCILLRLPLREFDLFWEQVVCDIQGVGDLYTGERAHVPKLRFMLLPAYSRVHASA